jgi:high frequency lysogenization protein
MIKTLTHQAIALAGLSQAVFLVQQIARRGVADREAMEASLGSALKIDADDVLDVYGGLHGVAAGLRQLEKQLAGPGKADPEQARYASTLIFLERKLIQRPDMVEAIGATVRHAAERAEEWGVLNDEVLKVLADAYQRTLSALKPRVLVAGEQRHLADPDNAHKIRALLLAGIRSVVLWRQCGGSRWKLLFYRTRLQQETRRLLQSL